MSRMIELASESGRDGYRRITMMLRVEGWPVNPKRIYRLWRQEGLKVPAKQPKRRRLWLNDSSCIRLRPEHRDHVWNDDFVFDRTHDGKRLRTLTVIDEFTRECLAIDVARSLTSEEVLERLSELFIHEAHRASSAPTTALSSRQSEFATGWRKSTRRLCSWNRAVRGRIAPSNHSTANCVMSCSTSKSFDTLLEA